MHPRNIYRTPPDFLALAESYPPLKPYLIQTSSGPSVNFHDIAAQKCLTQALLERDFGLRLVVPDDRLCPPVPNRLNYILWIQDILKYTNIGASTDAPVAGLDIGTGASAIYPLLGCSTSPNWNFVATDIDSRSLEHARHNVHLNKLEHRIRILDVSANGPVFAASIFEICPNVDFTMCNPPFYSDRADVLRSAEAKEFGPNAVCTGADTEMITPGGESAFVARMVEESLQLRTRCRWYTSMLGKMSSVVDIVASLRDRKIDNYAITEFVQGKTRRWAIAWSFDDVRLPDCIARIHNPSLHASMPSRNTLTQPLSPTYPLELVHEALQDTLIGIEGVTVQTEIGLLHSDEPKCVREVIVAALANTWSRAARRKKRAEASSSEPQGVQPALVCRVGILHNVDIASQQAPEVTAIEFNWVKGHDRALFESFMSHVAKKLEIALKASGDRMVT